MKSIEAHHAVISGDVPEGVTGVRTVETGWIDSLDVVARPGWVSDDAFSGWTFVFDSTGRDDLTADKAEWADG